MRRVFNTALKHLQEYNKSWIIGDSMPRELCPELHSHKTRVKCSDHSAGDSRDCASCSDDFASLVILLKGEVIHEFFYDERGTSPLNLLKDERGNLTNRSLLTKEGDSIFYGPGVYHNWRVRTDNTRILTIQFQQSSD